MAFSKLWNSQILNSQEGYVTKDLGASCYYIFQVLLVSSLTKPGSWIVPAGKVQAGEEAGACAMREAMEEAGALGRLGRFLGTYDEQFLRPSNSSTSSNNRLVQKASTFIRFSISSRHFEISSTIQKV